MVSSSGLLLQGRHCRAGCAPVSSPPAPSAPAAVVGHLPLAALFLSKRVKEIGKAFG